MLWKTGSGRCRKWTMDLYGSPRRWKDADIRGADEGRSLQGAVVLSCLAAPAFGVGLQLIRLGVEGAQEAGESRSLRGAPVFFPADDGHLVHPGQPREVFLVQAELMPETLDPLAEGAGGETRDGQEQFDRSSGSLLVVVNSGRMGVRAATSLTRSASAPVPLHKSSDTGPGSRGPSSTGSTCMSMSRRCAIGSLRRRRRGRAPRRCGSG